MLVVLKYESATFCIRFWDIYSMVPWGLRHFITARQNTHLFLLRRIRRPSCKPAQPERIAYLFVLNFSEVTEQHLLTIFLPEQRRGTSELLFKGKCLADSASRDLWGGGAADPTSSSSQLSLHAQPKHALFTISFRAKLKIQTGFLITYKGSPDLKTARQDLQVLPKLSNSSDLPTMLISKWKQNQFLAHVKLEFQHSWKLARLIPSGGLSTL